MFLRRLGGWLPRPWGRRKPMRPDPPYPEPRRVDSSSENSGSDWDSAPETMEDVGHPKTKDSGALRVSRAASEPSKEEPQVEQLGSKRMDSLKWDQPISSTQESGRLEAGGASPKLRWDHVDSGGTRRPGVSPEGDSSVPGPGAPLEKPGRREKLLGWLRGEPGAPSRYLGGPEECLQISTNLTLHLLELLASALLALCSRPLRAALDTLGLRGPLGLWLHGLLSFLAALHGLHAVLSLLTAHPLHFACLFGLLQALVLAVSSGSPMGMRRPLTGRVRGWRGKVRSRGETRERGCDRGVGAKGEESVGFRRKV
uniref:G4 protein n=1 Tax=Homo sapiens TaxID=9606 RepID=Q9UMP7_HUMAN|nr:G4 protein [Homo sapiens]